MNRIYTKKGDKGTTMTFYGEMGKGDQLAEVLGSIDELNSWVGFVRSQINNLQFTIYNEFLKSKFTKIELDRELKNIQDCLLTTGSLLAGGKKRLRDGEIKKLERLIDKLTDELPPLKNFIYPVGEIQVARAVCRRAERKVVRLSDLPVYQLKTKTIIKYLNRLSDALFTIARWVNYESGIKDEVWK